MNRMIVTYVKMKEKRNENEVVNVHQLIAVLHASQKPHNKQSGIEKEQKRVEGNAAVERGGDVTIGVHHKRLAGNLEVCRRWVAESQNDVILAFLRNVVMDEDPRVTIARIDRVEDVYFIFSSTLGKANLSDSGMINFPSIVQTPI